MIRAAALALALSLAGVPAGARDAPAPPFDDPIAAVLADPEAYATDLEEEEAQAPAEAPVATQPPAPAPPPRPSVLPPTARPPVVVRPPRPERPVNIDERGRSPDSPPRPQDVGYDMRIRAGIAKAQNRQGPLDGGWTVAAADGTGLYNLQLVDPDAGGARLEGAWRSLQRHGLGTTGLIASLDAGPANLVVRFSRRHADNPTVLTLQPRADGSWAGEMWEDGKVQPVTMRRG